MSRSSSVAIYAASMTTSHSLGIQLYPPYHKLPRWRNSSESSPLETIVNSYFSGGSLGKAKGNSRVFR